MPHASRPGLEMVDSNASSARPYLPLRDVHGWWPSAPGVCEFEADLLRDG